MKKLLKWVGIVFAGLLVLGIVIDATESPEQRATEAAAMANAEREAMESLPLFTASEIARAYDANTVAADQQFKGKRFKVTPTVDNINTDFMGNPYLTLRGGVNQFMEPQFAFNENQSEQLASVKPGEKVTLVCVGRGDVAKTPMSGDCVMM